MVYWQLLIGTIFIWTGFVCAISFMEAWLKFRAPGVTLPVGLSIGRLIFRGLNRVEWCLGLVSLLLFYLAGGFGGNSNILLLIPLLILLLQTTWLLPVMNKRVDLVISGANVPKSVLHFYYVGAELVKVVMLIWLGMRSFENF